MNETETEETPLLGQRDEFPFKKKVTFALGTISGVLSALGFACGNYLIKTWKVDFLDVLG